MRRCAPGIRSLTAVMASYLAAAPAAPTLTIVTTPRVPAFQRTVDAVKAVSEAAGVAPRVVETNGGAGNFCDAVAAGAPEIVLSVGTEAARLSGPCAEGAPRVAALTIGPGPTRRIAPLDVPPAEMMRAARRWFPQARRIGAIVNRATALHTPAEIEAAAREASLRPMVVECARPEDLPAAFERLAQDCDLVWCLPDTQLYTAATLKRLVLASLSTGVPLVGFSESFLRSGAAMALYPDFDRVASHTADCVRLMLARRPVPAASPAYFVVGVNRRVMRLLHLTLPAQAADRAVVFID